ncbi:MAG: hypothetical protein B6D61_00385, partial [Bacteroidetes bacterium 4484_249]
QTLYWEHESGRKSLRLNYNTTDNSITGINVFGIRLRHEVCQQWIKEGKRLNYVLDHLADANFDPEFFKKHEKEIFKYFTYQLMSCTSQK